MNGMAKISFVVPVYNSSKYLERCIDSILGQTENDFELVLVDDGSIDGSDKICLEYSKRDNRVKFSHQENAGVSVARNKGIKMATSNWIAFVDSDDWVEKDYVKHLLPYLGDNDIIFFKYKIHRNDSVKKLELKNDNVLLGEDEFRKILLDTIDTGINNREKVVSNIRGQIWSKVYNRDFLLKNEIWFDEKLRRSQDVMFNIMAYNSAKKGIVVEQCLYNYRIENGSLCHSYNENQKKHLLLFLDSVEEYVYSSIEGDMEKVLNKRRVLLFSSIVLIDFTHPNNRKKYSQRKKEYMELRNSERFHDVIESEKLCEFGLKKGIIVWCEKNNLFILLNIISKVEKRIFKA